MCSNPGRRGEKPATNRLQVSTEYRTFVKMNMKVRFVQSAEFIAQISI
jgi:hypothetical protein